MKKNFIQLALLLLSFLLSACGGSTTSQTSAKNGITIQSKKSLLSQDHTKLSIDFLVKNEYNRDISVELNNLSVDVEPCVVKEVVMTPKTITFSNELTQQYVNALMEFDEACTPTSFNLIGLSELGLNGKNNTQNYTSEAITLEPSEAVESNASGNTPDEMYQFYNVPAPISISTPNTTYEFKVQLINLNAQGVSDQEVKILAYDITYGEIENMSATTDANGFATFAFTSPKSFSEIDGQTLSLTLVNGEGLATVSTYVELKFDETIPTFVDTASNYQLKTPAPLTITQGDEEQSASIALVDNSGIGVEGKTLFITTLESQYGYFNTSSATTDAAGRATFTYKAPKSIDSINGQSISATIRFTENNSTISQTITIYFRKAVTDTIISETTTPLPTIVIPSNLQTITLSTNSKIIEIPIKVYLNNTPYSDGSVNVKLPEKVLNGVDVGSFSEFSVSVDEQGVATFDYTGPNDLKALVDSGDTSSIFKFYHSDNSSAEKSIQVNYLAYSILVVAAENDFSMTTNDSKEFTITLKDADGTTINDSDINDINITIQTNNSSIAQILDLETNTSVNTLNLEHINSTFTLKSQNSTGTVSISIIMHFTDSNKMEQNSSTTINVTVTSIP